MVDDKYKTYTILLAIVLALSLLGLLLVASQGDKESEKTPLPPSECTSHVIRQANDEPYKIQTFVDGRVAATFLTYGPVIERTFPSERLGDINRPQEFDSVLVFKTIDGLDMTVSSNQNPWILFDPE